MRQARHPDVRVVLHGHFYQPPRESPWTDEVPRQESAAPNHDWNERVFQECYRPNTASRVLDGVGRIRAIVNNFTYMSFNVGPTLMHWLEREHPATHARIVEADRASVQAHSGHGNAIAQAYHHMIMPLANARDRRTQILWGLRDFEYRFGRPAEGMWLPETAINMETVEALIDCGVRYTVLSPYQARRIRPFGEDAWSEVSGGRVDPRMPYRIFASPAADGSPRSLDVFFYDGPISRAVAFEDLLRNADTIAERLALAVDPAHAAPQIISLAVDGETFGHHAAFGDMCLASFFIEKARPRGLKLSNYGELLESLPPTHEVELELGDGGEGTAWSCAHGVGRWIRDCGCSTGGPPHWQQQWRAPLRAALDELRDAVARRFETRGGEILHDPWKARDDYVEVVTRKAHPESADPEVAQAFLARHLRDPSNAGQRVVALELLEAQRHAMSMYTSCAWFFTDITGIETVQNLRYAARCIQLMQPHCDDDLEERFVTALEAARSNNGRDTGATIYRNWVGAEVRTPQRAVSARALFRLLDASSGSPHVYGFEVREDAPDPLQLSGHRALRGRLWLRDQWTLAESEWSYLAIAYAPRHLHCFVAAVDAQGHADLARELAGLPEDFELSMLESALTALYGAPPYGIRDLLPDQRRRIAERLAVERVASLRLQYRAAYEKNLHLLEDFAELELELPPELQAACEFTLQGDLAEAASNLTPPFDPAECAPFVGVHETARRLGIHLDLGPAAEVLTRHLVDSLHVLLKSRELQLFTAAENLMHLIEEMQIPIDRTKCEETIYRLLQTNVLLGRGPGRFSEDFAKRALAIAARLNLAVDDLPAPVHV